MEPRKWINGSKFEMQLLKSWEKEERKDSVLHLENE
jgi:hypothetical protein